MALGGKKGSGNQESPYIEGNPGKIDIKHMTPKLTFLISLLWRWEDQLFEGLEAIRVGEGERKIEPVQPIEKTEVIGAESEKVKEGDKWNK